MNDLKTSTQQVRPVWAMPLQRESARNHLHVRVGVQSRIWSPPTDVYETEEAIIVRMEIAGMQKAEFSISLEDNLLTIQGTRPDTPERRSFHQMEIPFGEFHSQVKLHWVINQEAIQAEYKDGFLRIVLPKVKPHHIKIGE